MGETEKGCFGWAAQALRGAEVRTGRICRRRSIPGMGFRIRTRAGYCHSESRTYSMGNKTELLDAPATFTVTGWLPFARLAGTSALI